MSVFFKNRNPLSTLADFEESLNELRRMEQAKQCAEAELEQNSNEVLSEFLKRANAELSQLQESSQITKVRRFKPTSTTGYSNQI